MDPLLESYETRPYRHGAVPYTHPARLAAIARLLGYPPMPVDAARVLELGCGEGMNLLPLAERIPGGRFVGVDFSSRQIATAENARAAAGLANAALVCADLRTFEPEPDSFDYVIAHGVYSWVPDEVKDRLLAICAQALAPGGLAYVSYNVHPASGVIGGLREIVRAHLEGLEDPVAALPRLLAALDQSFAALPTPFAQLAREVIAEMRQKDASLVFHDELGPHNDPVAFLAFVEHAGRHRLGYVAEAHFAEMPWEHLSAGVRAPFETMRLEGLKQQGLLDLLGYRRFRGSILTGREHCRVQGADPAAVRECAIGFRMWPADGQIDLAPGTAMRLIGSNGFQVGVEKPGQKAFFAALCEAAPDRIPFGAAIRRARELVAGAGISEAVDEELLAKGVLRLFTANQCDLVLSIDRKWLYLEGAKGRSDLMFYQAANGLPVVNRWHETVDLSEDQRRFLAGADIAVDELALRKTGLMF